MLSSLLFITLLSKGRCHLPDTHLLNQADGDLVRILLLVFAAKVTPTRSCLGRRSAGVWLLGMTFSFCSCILLFGLGLLVVISTASIRGNRRSCSHIHTRLETTCTCTCPDAYCLYAMLYACASSTLQQIRPSFQGVQLDPNGGRGRPTFTQDTSCSE